MAEKITYNIGTTESILRSVVLDYFQPFIISQNDDSPQESYGLKEGSKLILEPSEKEQEVYVHFHLFLLVDIERNSIGFGEMNIFLKFCLIAGCTIQNLTTKTTVSASSGSLLDDLFESESYKTASAIFDFHFIPGTSLSFEEELEKVPRQNRILQTGKKYNPWPVQYFLGVTDYDHFNGWEVKEYPPKDCTAFHFYLGANAAALIEAFAKSSFAQTVERLSIGMSSYGLGSGMDYSYINSILAKAHFPALKILSFGVWELFENSHCAFGELGDITQMLKTLSHLEKLYLFGSFSLSEEISFPHLTELEIQLDDCCTGENGGSLSQSTFNALLSSDFPSLEETYLDIELYFDKNPCFSVPETFINGSNMPKIRRVELAAKLKEGEEEKLENGGLFAKLGGYGIFEPVEDNE